ncbi:hypothetical protein [Cupriavidus necator]|uniref:hypothetical protein n=1 Tax=Cupriavidus necator TaxID=106590 RepID=UPI003F4F42D4
MLANLLLHYAFDRWMQKHHPDVPFERYADDAICHCKSEGQTQPLKRRLEARLAPTLVAIRLAPILGRGQRDLELSPVPAGLHVAHDHVGIAATSQPRHDIGKLDIAAVAGTDR